MSYVDGFVVPVKTSRKQEFVAMSTKMSKRYLEWGALSHVEAWADDVKDGEVTDYKRAVLAESDETIVFSYVVWPDKQTRDAAYKKMMEDPEINAEREANSNPPFNMQRMLWGGFTAVVDVHAKK